MVIELLNQEIEKVEQAAAEIIVKFLMDLVLKSAEEGSLSSSNRSIDC